LIFRRRGSRASDQDTDESLDSPELDSADGDPAEEHRSRVGPWDEAERPASREDTRAIDLGGLVVTGRIGLELRLQTDQATGGVVAVMLVAQDGAVELRPFAAGRTASIWDDVRREIAAEASRVGGTATEIGGEYGPELRLEVPVRAPDGSSTRQTSRVVGVQGPRWLLRATYLGAPATTTDPDHVLTQAVRDVVVVRGQGAMAPREPLPLRLPANAQITGNESP